MDLLRHLRCFVAVADEGNISRAAEILHMAQPPLSRRIMALEKELGQTLIDRSRRKIKLTPAGELLLPAAQDVLAQADGVYELMAEEPRAMSVRLGVPSGSDLAGLAALIRSLKAEGVLLTVKEFSGSDLQSAWHRGDVDAALDTSERPDGDAQWWAPLGFAAASHGILNGEAMHIDELRLSNIRGSVAASAADPVAADAAATPAPPESRHLLLLPDDAHGPMRAAIVNRLSSAGLSLDQLVIAEHASSAVSEVLAGEGFLLCDAGFAQRTGLEFRPSADTELRRPVILRGRDALLAAARAHDDSEAFLIQLYATVGARRDADRPADTPRVLAPHPTNGLFSR
ncbi:LysR family transcriptional regulator [Saxibacter everestensis]|uniref:LysR family transcriptional regulator n=1 Tax=Saxibacter everestensis TaxID=2909229 RepID=A0ABY8QQQ6_9MICO|nr:LysR family transcriptional regulator [Brevibacteriaceae bacterium ZFBP1038]